MFVTRFEKDRHLTYDRVSYFVFMGTIHEPNKVRVQVVYDHSTGLAKCVQGCGHFDCNHAMYVQNRLRDKR